MLIASQNRFSAVEAAKVQPKSALALPHDSLTWLLQRLEPDPELLGIKAEPVVEKAKGVLIVDDSTLDKPQAKRMRLVTRPWWAATTRSLAAST